MHESARSRVHRVSMCVCVREGDTNVRDHQTNKADPHRMACALVVMDVVLVTRLVTVTVQTRE